MSYLARARQRAEAVAHLRGFDRRARAARNIRMTRARPHSSRREATASSGMPLACSLPRRVVSRPGLLMRGAYSTMNWVQPGRKYGEACAIPAEVSGLERKGLHLKRVPFVVPRLVGIAFPSIRLSQNGIPLLALLAR